MSKAPHGKPLGIDIKEKKMTLPLIYALSRSTWFEKRKIIGIVRNESANPRKVKEVISYVKASGGIEYAKQAMNRFHAQATEVLNTLPASVYKTSLEQLVQFTIDNLPPQRFGVRLIKVVGPPIDSVTMDNSGRIEWQEHKPECN